MPRKARLLLPNCPQHIVQREHNRKAVFVADEDYAFYLENLKEWKTNLAIKVYAWCLMTNHIHLVVEPGKNAETVSLLMKRLAGRQSAYVNKLEKRSGSLWEGRFKASPIHRDSYLLTCCRYVELNPVRARMVSDAGEYRWSSYRSRIGRQSCDWLDVDQCYMALGPAEDDGQARYKNFVAGGVSDSEKALLSDAVQRNQLTGSARFAEEIEMRYGLRVENWGRGRPCVAGK